MTATSMVTQHSAASTRHASTAADSPATTRMRRVMLLCVGIVGIIFTALTADRALSQADLIYPAWFAATTIVLWSIPVALTAIAPWAPMRWVRGMAVAYIVAYCVALIGWLPSMAVERMPADTAPWILRVLGVAVFATAILWSAKAAWIWLFALSLANGMLRFAANGGANLSFPLQDIVYSITSLTIFVATIIVVLSSVRQRDAAALADTVEKAAAAAAEAQRVQRVRVAALTHDEVLSALQAAAEATDATADLVRDHAVRTLQRLDALAMEDTVPLESMTAPEFITALRATVSAVAEGIEFEAPRYPAGDVPRDVAQAIIEATAESVRNSVRHAVPVPGNTGVSRSVRVAITGQSVFVIITDDGAGFDIGSLASDGFGIRVGILQRMAKVEGAHGNVDSAPGTGTRVLLTWVQPREGSHEG
ncbi:MAG: ATP-binding protein [Glaciihabitans sp.]|nr:ATP-binding protein [Glaciihabitans sp.]